MYDCCLNYWQVNPVQWILKHKWSANLKPINLEFALRCSFTGAEQGAHGGACHGSPTAMEGLTAITNSYQAFTMG